MRRRQFITLLGGAAAAAWPLAARAQQAERIRHIGVLMAFSENDPEAQSWARGFREELGKLGWTEGHNIQIDTRWATADVESLQRFAKQLVALQPDLILTGSTPATAAMRQCGNRQTPSPSFSRWLAILSAADSSRACRGRAAI
jgi:putative tryptophan/tyrosine transport system substrate-binding protein